MCACERAGRLLPGERGGTARGRMSFEIHCCSMTTLSDSVEPGDGVQPSGASAASTVPTLAELYLRTAHRIRRRSAPSYDRFGLTEAQARALRVISRYDRPRMADLAQALEVVPRSITSMVDTLEAAGFVTREPDPTDRRATIVVLTTAGTEVLRQVGRMKAEAAEQLFAKLSPSEQEELRRLLELLEAGEEPLAGRRPRGR